MGRNAKSTKTRIETSCLAPVNLSEPGGRNAKSTKTRIETRMFRTGRYRFHVAMRNPLKQGLKLCCDESITLKV